MSKYYYHGLQGYFSVISKMLEIFQTGGLKCRRLLGEEESGYNGLDYISVCKKYSSQDYKDTAMDNAFYTFVQDSFCFIISDRIDAIKTKPAGTIKWDDYSDSLLSNKQERISDMFDEWQVYQEIPLSMIVGIGLPVSFISSIQITLPSDCETIRKLRQVLILASELGLDIVDTDQQGFVEEYEKEKEVSSAKIYQISKQFEEGLEDE